MVNMKQTLPLLFLLIFEGIIGCSGKCGGNDSAACQSPHCEDGCARFDPSSTCRSVCSSSQLADSSDAENTLSCLEGCRMAADSFAQSLHLRSPSIIPESITDTAINLLWRNEVGEEQILGGTFYLQSSRADRPQWKNEHADFKSTVGEQVLRVENLVPYEQYRFRVAWTLPELEVLSPPSKTARTKEDDLGHPSPPSKTARTKADDLGRPSRPILESVRQERGRRVNIAWKPPLEPLGPLAFYRLSIRSSKTDVKHSKEVRSRIPP